ncbi:MAG: ECF-type sigma factor [Planctomycetota bacterium]
MDSESSNEKPSQTAVTDLLNALPGKQEDLYELVYDHLKAIARNRLAGENRQKALQTTALVNEAYLKLARQKSSWRDRRHFYGVAGEAMRRILIDEARSRKREKRGGNFAQQPLSGICLPEGDWDVDLLGLDDALTELEKTSPDHAEIVRLKFFSGLTFPECAEILETSLSTIERRWRFARAWLKAKFDEK